MPLKNLKNLAGANELNFFQNLNPKIRSFSYRTKLTLQNRNSRLKSYSASRANGIEPSVRMCIYLSFQKIFIFKLIINISLRKYA